MNWRTLRITRGDRLLPEMLARIHVDWDTGCWRWTGTVDANGYGRMGRNEGAAIHRHMYRETVGAIPEGFDVDHQCHNWDMDCPGGKCCIHRRCVNPDHLEAVTHAENLARSNRFTREGRIPNHCGRGHAWNEENTYRAPSGGRQCRACNRLLYHERRAA